LYVVVFCNSAAIGDRNGALQIGVSAPSISTIDGVGQCAHDILVKSPEIGEQAIVPLASDMRAADMSRPQTEDSDS
jgi:hypothetical protein